MTNSARPLIPITAFAIATLLVGCSSDENSGSVDHSGSANAFQDGSAPSVPETNSNAAPLTSPDPVDPFGALLDDASDAPTAGGPPTQPKNLRVDLVANDWAEFSWAPSNDDGEVVEYRILRSDGHTYSVRPDQTHPAAGSQEEIDKYWQTNTFIDCNYTRFDTRVHACSENGPSPGDTFSYQVMAVDDQGNESALSDPVTVSYHIESNAPVPVYSDFYLDADDRFAQEHDLSDTAFFLDEFELVFEEEFDGDEVDASKWNTELTWGDTRIINGEQQYFVNTQAAGAIDYNPFRFGDSSLIIEAIPTPAAVEPLLPPICNEPDPLGVERCTFLSGALSSHDKFGMTYGYVEGRIKVSDTPGALSSFYLYHRYPGEGLNLHAPEIDMVEYLGENPFGEEDAFQTYHYVDTATGIFRSSPTMAYQNPEGVRYSEDFHTYGVLWEPQLVIWYIDGKEIKRLTGRQVARQQMNIVTYLVTGSAWAPTPDLTADVFPIQYEIDYIKAWQRPVYNGNGVYPDQ